MRQPSFVNDVEYDTYLQLRGLYKPITAREAVLHQRASKPGGKADWCDFQWTFRDMEQDERNKERAKQWNTRLRYF